MEAEIACPEPALTSLVSVSVEVHQAPHPVGAHPRLGLCSQVKIFLIFLGNSHFLGLCPSDGPPAPCHPFSILSALFAVVFSLFLRVLILCFCVSGAGGVYMEGRGESLGLLWIWGEDKEKM